MQDGREQMPKISVDNASISALSPSCRRDIYKIAVSAQDEALESLFRVASHSFMRAIPMLASVALAGRHSLVNFWTVPLHGSSDSRCRF